LTHWNRRITTLGFVGNVDVEYNFLISDHLGDSVSFARVFDLQFAETFNFVDVGNCDPSPNPTGSTIGCDDTFRFFGDIFFKFTLSGVKYEMELIGFCADDADPASCTDEVFYSAEQSESLGYVLEVKRVPAPGVLALVSVGLIGLGAARQFHRKYMDARRARNRGPRSG
jgi:hypothetical protein